MVRKLMAISYEEALRGCRRAERSKLIDAMNAAIWIEKTRLEDDD